MRRHPLKYVKLILGAAFVYFLWHSITSLSENSEGDHKDQRDTLHQWHRGPDNPNAVVENRHADDLVSTCRSIL